MRFLSMLALALATHGAAKLAHATSTIVPDQTPTLAAALAGTADTILVCGVDETGDHVISRPVVIRCPNVPGGTGYWARINGRMVIAASPVTLEGLRVEYLVTMVPMVYSAPVVTITRCYLRDGLRCPDGPTTSLHIDSSIFQGTFEHWAGRAWTTGQFCSFVGDSSIIWSDPGLARIGLWYCHIIPPTVGVWGAERPGPTGVPISPLPSSTRPGTYDVQGRRVENADTPGIYYQMDRPRRVLLK